MKDGGPAFPHESIQGDGTLRTRVFRSGMSLRDYFMAHAPALPAKIHEQFMSAIKRSGETDLKVYARIIAEWRHYYADAMMAERDK